jgi:hypothetical protein
VVRVEDEELVTGGMHICRPKPVVTTFGGTVGFHLMSDLHIGAAQVDYKLIQKEIDEVAESGDRLYINGDLLDLILPKDHKRYDPGALHPRISRRADVVNAVVDWAVELLRPVATQIDMIGIGNHEAMITRHHSIDPTLLVIYELEKEVRAKNPNHVIHYGGYTGFVDVRVRVPHGNKEHHATGYRWVLYYHHGSGAYAPVTKGLIDFNRKDTFVDADLIWMGHKHNRLTVAVEKISCPLEGDHPAVKDVRHVMTGSYFLTYKGQSQESVRKIGRRSNYAADAGLAPGGRGGARVLLKVKSGAPLEVKVVQ